MIAADLSKLQQMAANCRAGRNVLPGMPRLCRKLEITLTSTFILALNYQMYMLKYTVTNMFIPGIRLLFL